MGSGKQLKVSATGFPGTNETWRFIQSAWREPLEAMARMAGNKTIIYGITQSFEHIRTVYTNGYVSYNGEIIPFVGGAPSTNVTLIKETVNVEYDVDVDADGNRDVLPAYETKYFRFGTGGEVTFPFSDLKRLKTIKELSEFQMPAGLVIDPNYFAFTQAMYNHLMSLQTNVQADWSVSNPNSGAYIHNKPTTARVVATGLATVSSTNDVASGGTYVVIPIGVTMPNTDYMVQISLEVPDGWTGNKVWGSATLSYVVYDKLTTQFNVYLREWSSFAQSVKIRWAIIANN